MASALVVCLLATGADQADPAAFDLRLAVDGGLAWFRAQDTAPDLLVGDGDSVAPGDLDWARSAGTEVQLVSTDKDYTDFDLALQVCEERGVGEVTVIGALGGRLDQELGMLGALLRHQALRVTVRSATQFATALFAGQRYLCEEPVLSFGLVAAEAAIVSVSGARWPLDSARLEPLSTVGVSNEPLTGEAPEVSVVSGAAFFIGQRA